MHCFTPNKLPSAIWQAVLVSVEHIDIGIDGIDKVNPDTMLSIAENAGKAVRLHLNGEKLELDAVECARIFIKQCVQWRRHDSFDQRGLLTLFGCNVAAKFTPCKVESDTAQRNRKLFTALIACVCVQLFRGSLHAVKENAPLWDSLIEVITAEMLSKNDESVLRFAHAAISSDP